MKTATIVLDSRPGYVAAEEDPSLLLLPLGSGTVLEHVRRWVGAAGGGTPAVLPSFAPIEGYADAVKRQGGGAILDPVSLEKFCAALEPADRLLIVDPCCFPLEAIPPAQVKQAAHEARWATCWVALDGAREGTRELAELDHEGRISRIERFFVDVTWPHASGVACALLPATSLRLLEDLELLGSLARLRRALSERGVPGRDMPLPGEAVDLSRERGYLRISERSVLAVAAGVRGSQWIGRGATIDPTARVMGPAVIQDGAWIGPDATVIGPALIGAGTRVGRGSIVAQGVACGGVVIGGSHGAYGEGAHGHLADAADQDSSFSSSGSREGAGADEATGYERWKRAIDILASLVGLILVAPIILFAALAMKVGAPGPIFYGAPREGKGGKEFKCWKLRSMIVGADALQRDLAKKNDVDGPQFKMDDDPRITPVGRILRKTNIDELPQLWNVLTGEMSLIGPRPSPFRENQICVPWRRARLSVRPGITGLWQICRHERACGDFHQWIHYDTLYVRNVSASLDFHILLFTVLTAGGRYSVPVDWVLPRRNLA